MEKSFHYILGKEGEAKAIEYLIAHGYDIITTNYSCHFGEIDVIAREGKSLCFIEIKTRAGSQFGFPAEAISRRKQKKLITTARFYMHEYRTKFDEHRFDIVEVLYRKESDYFDFSLIKDAFEVF